jgi:hypothetical protein
MYVDVKAGFAVWWEPEYDAGIDSDTAAYASMFGPNSYYAKAPRVKDWDEFVETIRKYYRGELQGGKIEKFDFASLQQQNKKPQQKGCLGLLVLLIVIGGCITLL